jgi:hypothetical protein
MFYGAESEPLKQCDRLLLVCRSDRRYRTLLILLQLPHRLRDKIKELLSRLFACWDVWKNHAH